MNTSEAMRLLAHCAAFDNRQPSRVAAEAWAAALHDVPLDDDALAAVSRYYGAEDPQAAGQLAGQRWIQPHHVRDQRRWIRNDRLANSDHMVPPADPDDPAAYMAAYRRQIREIAAGRVEPPALPGGADGPDEENPHARKILAEFERVQEAKRARERAARVREHDAARAFQAAQELLLDQPDHGAEAIKQATEILLGEEQAAQGFPMRDAAVGTSDREKVIILAARNVAAEREPS